jgi:hypothetical protein
LNNLKILASFGAFVLLLAAGPALLQYTANYDLLVPKFWVLFTFITGFTFLVIATTLAIQRIKPDLYAQAFFASTIVKMLACMGFALIFVTKIPISHGVFLLNFCYLYFSNTAFEVYILLSNLRNQN